MAKYLLKFVSQKSHADTLVNGELFMRPAEYFHTLENRGQGDIMEGMVFPGVCIYKNQRNPIFCMTAIDDTDIKGKFAVLSEKNVVDFQCESGYAVLIDYEDFIELIKMVDDDEPGLAYGPVNYGVASEEYQNEMMTQPIPDNLFVKWPDLNYQKEFRVVYGKAIDINDDVKKPFIYSLKKDIKDFSKIIKISDIERKDGNLLIPLQ